MKKLGFLVLLACGLGLSFFLMKKTKLSAGMIAAVETSPPAPDASSVADRVIKQSAAGSDPVLDSSAIQKGSDRSNQQPIASLGVDGAFGYGEVYKVVQNTQLSTVRRWNALRRFRRSDPDLAQKLVDGLTVNDPIYRMYHSEIDQNVVR